MADDIKPEKPRKAEDKALQLDPTATLQEIMQLGEVKLGAARSVEDYLRNRVLVLATHNAQLSAANAELTAKVAQLTGQDE